MTLSGEEATEGFRFEGSLKCPLRGSRLSQKGKGLWCLVVLGLDPHNGGFVDKEDFFGTLFVFYIGQDDERLV
jgi:hypothetical protein